MHRGPQSTASAYLSVTPRAPRAQPRGAPQLHAGAADLRAATITRLHAARHATRHVPALAAASPTENWGWRPGQSKKQWGPLAWRWLHNKTIDYAQDPSEEEAKQMLRRIRGFISSLPCPECRTHSIEYLAMNPPDLSSSQALQAWAWRFHNAVNVRLGKRPLPFAAYSQLYLSEMCRANWSAAECIGVVRK